MKKRLFAVALTALLPAIGMLAYNEVWYRQQRAAEVRLQALQSSQQVASEVDRILEGARSLLIASSVAPGVADLDPAVCHKALAEIADQVPSVGNIAVADLNGKIVCDSLDQPLGGDISDRRYFKEALASKNFVIGGYTKGRRSNAAVLPVARSLWSGGELRGVLLTGLKLQWLQDRIEERGTLPEGTVAIADRDGTLVVRAPWREGIVGTKVAEAYMHLLNEPHPGITEAPGRDGTLRIIGYQPISADSPLYVAAGVSESVVFAAIDRATMTAVIMIALGGLAAALAAVFVGNTFILRPIQNVVSVLERWAGGDLKARTGMEGQYGEVGEVGVSVDKLLDELDRRRSQAEEAEAARMFMSRELSHRVKNTLSVVQAIARQTFGKVAPPEALDTYALRVRALAGAYDTLLADEWESGDILDIVARAIAPHHAPGDNRFRLSGPELALPPRAVVAISLILHELSTNAAKYGALSNVEGHIEIDWASISGRVTLHWREHGGPLVARPEREGFGTKVMSRAFPAEFQPEVTLDYRPEGLVLTLTFTPVEPVKEANGSDDTAA